jgi:molecular chaperone DnaJ
VRDFYKVLNVPRTATPDEIRRAYRSLALQFHPDRNSGSHEAEERFKELAEAFHTLSDPDRREVYDVWGPRAASRGVVLDPDAPNLDQAVSVFVEQFSAFVREELPEMPDFADLFDDAPRMPLRVRVTLAEVATGVAKEVPLPCVRCSGTGIQEGRRPSDRTCPTCRGSGKDATGETVRVEVPAGALTGDCVRVPRSGKGDLLAFVEVEEDPRFVRAGADVVLELALSEQWPNSEVEVPTPTGTTLVKIPQDAPLGGALRIPGHGLPARSRTGRGDLIVKLVAEGSEGAWMVPTPARTVAARSNTTKVVTAGLAFVLGGVTVALLGRAGAAVVSAGFAATTAQSTLASAPVSRVDAAAKNTAPASGSVAPQNAASRSPVDTSTPLRIPSAPVLTGLTLPGIIDVAPIYTDQPISSLSPIRPEAPAINATGPSLTAVTQAPRIRNSERVQQSLEKEYPIGLRAARIGGRVEMSFDIDAEGRVERFQIRESSGYSELDAAALRVAEVFEFSPALRGTQRVATSVTFGITFGDAGAPGLTGAGGLAPRAAANDPNQPVPAEFDVAPEVSNPERVRQSLLREYPDGLRDAGVGGHVDMWFYVNQQGVVERVQIGQGSGHTALDEAALRVARAFRFTPARRANQPVSTWISLRITFVGAK